jgi:hypothetical protein
MTDTQAACTVKKQRCFLKASSDNTAVDDIFCLDSAISEY